MSSDHGATAILRRVSAGDAAAANELLGVLYGELHAQAAAFMRQERPGHTLQATALVHEAYVRLVDQKRARWQDQAHFLAVAAQAMRRILVDHARGRGRAKRGGDRCRVPLTERALSVEQEPDVDLVPLDAALRKLETFDPQRARIVELRYFGGLTVEQVAAVLETPIRTVERGWNAARTWLHREITNARPEDDEVEP